MNPAGIDLVNAAPALEPTVCAPASFVRQLTLTSNAYMLGWLGFAAGICLPILFLLAWFRIGPWLVDRLGWG